MKKNFWKNATKYFRAFLILALAFLAIGLGTLGSVISTGDSFVLTAKQEGDAKEPSIMVHVMLPEGLDASINVGNVYVKKVLVNVGAVYLSAGESVELRIGRGSASDLIYDLTYPMAIPSVYSAATEETEAVANVAYNWLVFDVTEIASDGWRLRSYPYYYFAVRGGSVCINEVLFVAETNSLPEEEREDILLDTELDDASVIRRAEGESKAEALERASAVLDSQHLPSLTSSSFDSFSEEEAYSLMTIREMRAGGSYVTGDTYLADTVYSALGTDILALGTLIFGMSPFGLRFFPFLAAFGVLVVGYLFVRDLSKSERAGFIFAALYALSAAFFAAGHLGTPLMLGVFFFTASVYFCHKFYAKGMKTADLKGAAPVILSALFGALAICVNGVWTIPMLGVVALFAAGMVRQKKAKEYYLAKAEEAPEPVETAEKESVPALPPKQRVEAEYRFKDRAAIASFTVVFLVGTLLLSLLAVIPAYLPYVRVFGDPAAPMGVFAVAWKLFAGGFAGANATSYAQSWALHTIFAGTGELYAVTVAGAFTAIVAVVACIVALVWFLVLNKGIEKPALRALVIAAAGLVLSLVCSFFGGGAFGFSLAALVFLFALGGFAGDKVLAEGGKAAKAVMWVLLALLILSFVLLIPFTFSVPLPAGLQTALFA